MRYSLILMLVMVSICDLVCALNISTPPPKPTKDSTVGIIVVVAVLSFVCCLVTCMALNQK